MQKQKIFGNIAKGCGAAALAAALVSPALGNDRLMALISDITDAQTPLEPTGRLVTFNRSQFFALLEREDPRSPN